MRTAGYEILYLYYKNGNILAEKNGTVLGNVYVYGNGLENLIVGNTAYKYVKNAHGDVLKVVLNSTVLAEYSYDAYGNHLSEAENGIDNPIRYAGYYYDDETGNYYLKNRYYNSRYASFLTEDPYWNVNNMLYGNATDSVIRNVYYPAVVQSGNRFVYCAGKPIAFVDPSGTVLEIKCDRVNDIIEHISYLTHDDLRVMPKLDENGNPTDTYVVEILQEKDGDYDVGTELVRRLVKSEYTCIIFTDDRNTSYSVDFKNSTNGIGSDVEVEYNPNLIAEIPTYDYEQKGVRDQYWFGTRAYTCR